MDRAIGQLLFKAFYPTPPHYRRITRSPRHTGCNLPAPLPWFTPAIRAACHAVATQLSTSHHVDVSAVWLYGAERVLRCCFTARFSIQVLDMDYSHRLHTSPRLFPLYSCCLPRLNTPTLPEPPPTHLPTPARNFEPLRFPATRHRTRWDLRALPEQHHHQLPHLPHTVCTASRAATYTLLPAVLLQRRASIVQTLYSATLCCCCSDQQTRHVGCSLLPASIYLRYNNITNAPRRTTTGTISVMDNAKRAYRRCALPVMEQLAADHRRGLS